MWETHTAGQEAPFENLIFNRFCFISLLLTVCSFSYQIFQDESFSITKDGPIHKLVISKCTEEHSGKYRFEADGRKTEAMINVKGLRTAH